MVITLNGMTAARPHNDHEDLKGLCGPGVLRVARQAVGR
jgi:hypothetical protein